MILSLVGKPTNRALCANIVGVDTESYMCKGSIDYKEGVIIIGRRVVAAQIIPDS